MGSYQNVFFPKKYCWYGHVVLLATVSSPKLVPVKHFPKCIWHIYYPSKSAAVQQKKIVKPHLSQWYSYALKSATQVKTCEDIDMKPTSWIGTHEMIRNVQRQTNQRKTSTTYGPHFNKKEKWLYNMDTCTLVRNVNEVFFGHHMKMLLGQAKHRPW